LEFPRLISINESFQITLENNVKSISLPALNSVGADFEADRTSMIILNAPKLNYVGGSFEVGDNPALETAEFPSLNFIGGGLFHNFDVDGPQSLLSISYPVVTYIGGEVFIENNVGLLNISMPLLDTVGGVFYVQLNKVAQWYDLSSLRSVCMQNEGMQTNDMEPDIVYILCPLLINSGNCNFTVSNFKLPTSGCSNEILKLINY